MLSLTLGLLAAFCWGVHDVCVRFATERTSAAVALLTVLSVGLVLVGPLAALSGEWPLLTRGAILAALASGAVYAAAAYALYRAFDIGPVRLVAPIIAAFPVLSVLWAAARGPIPSADQIGAVFAIVAGVGLIAFLSDHTGAGTARGSRKAAIGWSAVSCVGFAATFAFGHVASGGGAELPSIFLTRAAAVLTLGTVMILRGGWPQTRGAPWKLLAIMGVCDVTAIALVQAAGALPRPEFAAVASSTFGMVTILLAWAFLKERVSTAQWSAAGLVFGGIAYLAL